MAERSGMGLGDDTVGHETSRNPSRCDHSSLCSDAGRPTVIVERGYRGSKCCCSANPNRGSTNGSEGRRVERGCRITMRRSNLRHRRLRLPRTPLRFLHPASSDEEVPNTPRRESGAVVPRRRPNHTAGMEPTRMVSVTLLGMWLSTPTSLIPQSDSTRPRGPRLRHSLGGRAHHARC